MTTLTTITRIMPNRGRCLRAHICTAMHKLPMIQPAHLRRKRRLLRIPFHIDA
jgi:hypothetical protein